MANNRYNNKVIFGSETLIDLSEDTVTPENLMAGKTAHDKSGTPITGTFDGSDYALKSDAYLTSDSVDTAINDSDYIPLSTSAGGKKKSLWSNIIDKIKAALGTAALKNVPTSGDASSTEVVLGNDSRLSDSRPASDVSSWAKQPTKPTYSKNEVGLGNVPNVATNDQTPTFTQASSRANIASGEKLSVILGKIMKFFADLGSAAFTASTDYATSGHTHTVDMGTDSGTATVTLAANTVYKLSVAGNSVIFKTPADANNDHYPSAYCSTDGATAAKVASCTNYALLDNSWIHVLFKNSNTVQGAITLNINGKGAKPIYVNNAATSSSNYTLPAGTYLAKYVSGIYYFRTDGKLPASITGDAATVNGKTVEKNVPSDANFTNTWRGIQDNLTSDSTTDSLSAKQGKNLANGSARDSTKLPLAGGTLTGVVTSTYTSSTYVNSLTKTAFRVTPSSFGGWISGTTKNGNITIATYPSSDNKIYFGYGESGRTANSYAKQMTWDGSTGNLAVTSINGYTIYDHSKAIKAITRSGTTFTYTCLDGTTGTFTQQDNDTTNVLNQRSTYITGSQAIFTRAQLTVGTADNNAYAGSSNNHKLFSFPDGKTGVSGSNANIMNMRFMWGTSHWRDMFMSPNNDDIYIRGVVDGTAKPWYKLFDSGDTIGFANGGTGATTRLGAAKALTNENVSTNVEYVVGLTNSWGKFGYVSLADLITKLPNYKRFYSSWVYNIKIVSSTGSGQTIWLFTQEGYITMGTSGSAISIGYCNMANASHWTYSKSGLTITLNCTDHIKPFILCSDNAITVTFTDTSTAQSSTLSNQWATAGHTHPCTIAADSGTNALTLAASTKYKLTAGGSSFIFTTPPNTTYSRQTAASGGTTLSLVNTGDMYRWDNNYRAKSDSLNTYYYKKTITTSTSSTVTATFTVTHYTADMALSVFDVYVDNLNAKYTDIASSGTKVAVTFAKTSSAFSVEVTLIQIVTTP